MKTRVKIILVTIVAIILLVLGFVIAINNKKESINYFSNKGYIIGNVYEGEKDKAQIIRFDDNSTYKKHSDKELKITNSEGERVIVNKESFVHFENDSIMALKNGVAIDLNNIDSKLLSYYNISTGAVLNKVKDGYQIKNIDNDIIFNKLMYKISDDKYLISANNIIVSFSEEQTINFNNYIEIEYVNEDVVRIYNNESSYQSISSKAVILIDNIKIDLEYKTIEKNGVKYLTMADLVINANDNIEILKEKEEDKEQIDLENNEDSNNNNNNNNNQNSSSNNQGVTGSDIDTSVLDGLTPINPNETIKEEDNIQEPKVIVEELDVTMMGIGYLKMVMLDEDSVAFGNSKVEIVENSTGKKITDLSEWNEGNYEYIVNQYANLKPNTEYTLMVSGIYKIDGVEHNRIYVSKIFRTLDVGLEVLGDCASSDSLSFAIYKKEDFDVYSVKYSIVDSKNQTIYESDNVLKFGKNDYVIAYTPSGLKLNSNSTYKLVITEIEYDFGTVSIKNVPNLKIEYKMKTLKQSPNSDIKITSNVNALKNQITLGIDNVKDKNKGIKSYTYKIYSVFTGENIESQTPIYTARKEDSSELVVDIAELGQGESFRFAVEIEFDDNEKTIIYDIQNKNVIHTSNTLYPSIESYNSDPVNCEQLSGYLKLVDPDGFIFKHNISEYKILLKEKKNSLNSTQYYESEMTILTDGEGLELPVYFGNLKPNTQYTLSVYLKYSDGYVYVDQTTVETEEPDPLHIVMVNKEEEADVNLFDFEVKLNPNYFSTDQEFSEFINSYPYITKNLDYITLDLHGCNGSKCNKVKEFSISISNENGSDELTKFLSENNFIKKTSKDFDFWPSNYDSSYEDYKIYVRAYSKTNYNIPLYINGEKTNYFDLIIKDTIPTVEVKVNDIINSEKENKDNYESGLDDDTVIGFKLDLNEIHSTKGVGIKNFYYAIYEGLCDNKFFDENFVIVDNKIESNNVNLVASNIMDLSNQYEKEYTEEIYFSKNNISRGKNYCLVYKTNFENENKEIVNLQNYENIGLITNKQHSKTTGYLNKYTENSDIYFRLKINDVDKEINEIYIKNGEEKYKLELSDSDCENNNYCTYYTSIPELQEIKKFELYINTEPRNELIQDKKIYEFTLENLINLGDNKPLIFVGTEPGKLKFVVNDLGVDILGLRIGQKYLELEKQINDEGVVSYEGTINNANLNDYGIEKNKAGNKILLDANKFHLVYTNGRINSEANEMTLKEANLNLEGALYYYNYNSEKFEQELSLDSVYLKIEEEGNSKYKTFNGSNYLEYEILQYPLYDSIGLFAYDSIVNFYQISYKAVELSEQEITINSELITKNDIVYTPTGAKIKFNIQDKEIFSTLTAVNFELTCDGLTEVLTYEYNGNGFKNPKNTSHISSIEATVDAINIKVNNIKDFNSCSYGLTYNSGNGVSESINEENGQSNRGYISALKTLNITNSSIIYRKVNWFENKDKIKFEKNLDYSFDIIQNYDLEGEKLYYDIYVNDVIVGEGVEISTDHIDNTIDLYNYIGKKLAPEINKTYLYPVIIKPYIGSKTNYLDDIKLTDSFEIKNGIPNIRTNGIKNYVYLNVNDIDGIFDKTFENYEFKLSVGEEVIHSETIAFNEPTNMIKIDNVQGKLDYNVSVCYKTIFGSEVCSEPQSITLFDPSTLNASLIPAFDRFMIRFASPDEKVKDSIKKIKYSWTYHNNESSPTITLTNVEDGLGSDNKFTYSLDPQPDGTTDYYVFLPLSAGVFTTDIKNFQVSFYDSNGEFATLSYSPTNK